MHEAFCLKLKKQAPHSALEWMIPLLSDPNQAILLLSQWNNNENGRNSLTLSDADYQRTQARITQAYLYLVDNLSDEELAKAESFLKEKETFNAEPVQAEEWVTPFKQQPLESQLEALSKIYPPLVHQLRDLRDDQKRIKERPALKSVFEQGEKEAKLAVEQALKNMSDADKTMLKNILNPPVKEERTPKAKRSRKNYVLFVCANPINPGMLQLEKEHSAISEKLQDSKTLRVYARKNVTWGDMNDLVDDKEIREYLHVFHFSGHGDQKSDEYQKMARSLGFDSMDNVALIVNDPISREPQRLRQDAIVSLFNDLKSLKQLKYVVFNCCFSEEIAKAVSNTGQGLYVVGVRNKVPDNVAIDFSTGLYNAYKQDMTTEGFKSAVSRGITRALQNNFDRDSIKLFFKGEPVTLP